MSSPTYRVVQWATGSIGQIAIRHFVDNPVYELVGVYVTNPDKVGSDAGELAGIPTIGVPATDDLDAIIALEPDCVHYAPLHAGRRRSLPPVECGHQRRDASRFRLSDSVAERPNSPG